MVFLRIYSRVLLALLALAWLVDSVQKGDRISAVSQTLHQGWKTQVSDLALHLMPRFRVPDSVLLHVGLPHPDENGAEMKLKPDEDVKVSFAFDNNRLAIPWVTVFDSKGRRSLQKLEISFVHDDFDVEKVNYVTTYGPRIARLDPSHPSLTTFEIIYKWDAVQEEDLASGLVTMFIVVIVGLIPIVWSVISSFNHRALMYPYRGKRTSSSGSASASGIGAGVGGGVALSQNKLNHPPQVAVAGGFVNQTSANRRR